MQFYDIKEKYINIVFLFYVKNICIFVFLFYVLGCLC
jgi:hypothetical protein